MQLLCDEFLNVDSILEEVLTTLVMKPLQPHLKTLFNNDFERTGCLQTLRGNMARLRKDPNSNPNSNSNVVVSRETAAECSDLLSRLREAYSPVQKLDHFLGVVKAVLQSVSTITGLSKLRCPQFELFAPYLNPFGNS